MCHMLKDNSELICNFCGVKTFFLLPNSYILNEKSSVSPIHKYLNTKETLYFWVTTYSIATWAAAFPFSIASEYSFFALFLALTYAW